MKAYLSSLIILLTILLRVEFFALDGASAYDSNLPIVADTEWVHDEQNSYIYNQEITEDLLKSSNTPTHSKFLSANILYNYHQRLYYPEKLQLSVGYIFVTFCPYRSNIPHQNSDDEDPSFYLG